MLNNSVVKDLLYCPFRTVINQRRRWWWMIATITSVWLDEGHMEHIVNLMHAVWEIQTISIAAHASHYLNFERSNPYGCI